jgi:hypothetical protein
MKREAKLLLEKASDSLVLAIELFNRPHDRGRVSSTLIQLDHAFEMLMKAAILHRGGRIREKRANQTIGFDACVRRSLSDGRIKYLTDEQALVLQTINGLRDAAQHHLLDISEGQLYIHVQSGVTLFRDLLKKVFDQDLTSHLPERVLPVSTSAPTDLAMLFDSEINEIKKLLQPGRRRRIEVLARLRPLAIVDATMFGKKAQPSDSNLRRISHKLLQGKAWEEVFPGAAAVEITGDGTGQKLSLRLSKKEGIPIQLVPEGTPDASVVAVRRINDWDYYSMSAKQLAAILGLSVTKTVAIVDYLGLRKDEDCYKEFPHGSQWLKRYSQRAIERINEALQRESADEIWAKRRTRAKGGRG